jgi:hypothetical protein
MMETKMCEPGCGQPDGGGCPECGDTGKRLHSRSNPKDWGTWWGVCDECKLRWYIGEAEYWVFHPEGEDHWRQIERRMSEYREVVVVS